MAHESLKLTRAIPPINEATPLIEADQVPLNTVLLNSGDLAFTEQALLDACITVEDPKVILQNREFRLLPIERIIQNISTPVGRRFYDEAVYSSLANAVQAVINYPGGELSLRSVLEQKGISYNVVLSQLHALGTVYDALNETLQHNLDVLAETDEWIKREVVKLRGLILQILKNEHLQASVLDRGSEEPPVS